MQLLQDTLFNFLSGCRDSSQEPVKPLSSFYVSIDLTTQCTYTGFEKFAPIIDRGRVMWKLDNRSLIRHIQVTQPL